MNNLYNGYNSDFGFVFDAIDFSISIPSGVLFDVLNGSDFDGSVLSLNGGDIWVRDGVLHGCAVWDNYDFSINVNDLVSYFG